MTPNINSWKKFAKIVRSKGCFLLKNLENFPNSILVTGCQRSGTTMLSRIITQSEGMFNYWFGKDDELAAALILSGYVKHKPQGRYCFQTTYLNECYHEYFNYINFPVKIIWVLRNPYSVVYSMVYNWSRFALNELFLACGFDLLNERQKKLYKIFGTFAVNKFLRACYAYVGKTSQIFEIASRFKEDKLMIIDYDDLVKNKEVLLPLIYDFINLKYNPKYANKIHSKSLNKAKKLKNKQRDIIKKICIPVYERAQKLLSYTNEKY